jgi:hypothetical protein
MKFKLSYEKQIYSQQGEDGIIEQLIGAIKTPNKICVEMGWGKDHVGKKAAKIDYAQNCTSNLIHTHGYTGFAWDAQFQHVIPPKVKFSQEFLRPQNVPNYIKVINELKPDFYSLDIDSFDYEIMTGMLYHGFAPKAMVLEFNIRWGWDIVHSMPYYDKGKYEKTSLFHGVSYRKYRNLLEKKGYKFFTLDTRGINMFFYNPNDLDESKLPDERHITIETAPGRIKSKQEINEEIKKHPFWNSRLEEIQ